MAVPTRYAALPYHFQLDEHEVRAGLVENLNTKYRIEKGRLRWKETQEKSGREKMSGWWKIFMGKSKE